MMGNSNKIERNSKFLSPECVQSHAETKDPILNLGSFLSQGLSFSSLETQICAGQLQPCELGVND